MKINVCVKINIYSVLARNIPLSLFASVGSFRYGYYEVHLHCRRGVVAPYSKVDQAYEDVYI